MAKAGFSHPQNKEKKGGIQVYSNRRGILRYPDYMHPLIIADAKYKRLYHDDENPLEVGVPRDDLNQMISYLHITQRNIGAFICPRDIMEFPSENGEPVPEDRWNLIYHRLGVLNGLGGEIHVISVNIPQHCPDFKSFYTRMESIEASLEWKLNRVISGEDESKEFTYA